MGLNNLEPLEGKIKTPENNLSFSEMLQLAELKLLQRVVFWALSLFTVVLLSVVAMGAYNVSQGKDISQLGYGALGLSTLECLGGVVFLVIKHYRRQRK